MLLSKIFIVLGFLLGSILLQPDAAANHPKRSEHVKCLKDKRTGDYLIPFGASTDTFSSISIPKRYFPDCQTRYPVSAGKLITFITVSVNYPSMDPRKGYSNENGVLNIHLSPLGTSPPTLGSPKKTSVVSRLFKPSYDLTAHIQNNINAIDDNGKKRHSPVKKLENGFFAIFDNLQPTYGMIYSKTPKNKVSHIFHCHIENMSCEADMLFADKAYIRYSFSGVKYQDLLKVDEAVKKFLVTTI